jgi:hypothetical protein
MDLKSIKDRYELIPTRKIEIDTSITDLVAFAKAQGINYKILKFSLASQYKIENATNKKYTIEIPLSSY